MSWDELEVLAKEYHSLVKQGYGIDVSNRCERQIEIVNEIVVRVSVIHRLIAYKLINKGVEAFRRIFFVNPRDEIEDLVQDGRVGLFESLDSYDPEGLRFFTFVCSMAVSNMVCGSNGRMGIVHVPRYLFYDCRSVLKEEGLGGLENSFSEKGNVSNFYRGMAVKLGISGKYIDLWFVNVNLDRVYDDSDLRNVDRISFEQKFLEAEGRSPLESVELMEVSKVVEGLNEKMKTILRYRFYEDLSFEKIGIELGITREYARQVEIKALELLRKRLRDFR